MIHHRYTIQALLLLLISVMLTQTSFGNEKHDRMGTSVAKGPYRYVIAKPTIKRGAHQVETIDKYPLVLSLHGASLRGKRISMLSRYGTIAAIESGLSLPAFVVAPQCPSGQRWQPEKLNRLIELVCKQYPIDTARIYVIGMSLGGYGTFDFVGTYPDKVAAAIALCGGGQTRMAEALSKVPMWVIHGRMDRDVPPSQSQRIVHAICVIDSTRCYYTEIEKLGHGALAESYNHSKLYDWLFQHRLAVDAARVAVPPPQYGFHDFTWNVRDSRSKSRYRSAKGRSKRIGKRKMARVTMQ
jgi:predicted esterase